MSRDKKNDLNTIKQSAKLYEKNLLNKNILFIYLNNNKLEYYEVTFLKEHFKHLTGVKTELNSHLFFYKAVNNRIKLEEFDYKDNTTGLKIDNLIKSMSLNGYAKMIGDFKHNKVYLSVSKIAGNNNLIIGFDEGNKMNYPKTLLKGDLRAYTLNKPHRIVGILTKELNEHKYKEITYLAKNIRVERLLKDKNLSRILNVEKIKKE